MSHGYVDNHDAPPRGAFNTTGRFGRMFPTLPPLELSASQTSILAAAMFETGPSLHATLPAGFTYLGQFIDHDITFDPTSMPEVAIDPSQVHNFRTVKLELDSLYGIGPAVQPYLYSGAKFVLGQTLAPGAGDGSVPSGPHDLPRASTGKAIVGDPRNDENLAVAQTHLAFMRFHNAVVDFHAAAGVPPSQLFDRARKDVIWHYQWLILEDFLPRILDPVVLADVRRSGRRFFRFETDPFMPVEFSVAAYRLGHSLVRDAYDWNRVFGVGIASLQLLFRFTGKSGTNVPVPADWPIAWSHFVDLPGHPPAQKASRLDTKLAQTLGAIPVGVGNLASLNLTRGSRMGLPSGQAIAGAMYIPPLSAVQLASGSDGAALAAAGLVEQTPLWFYILKEAEVLSGGSHLGPVGSRIVAEVFLGLLQGDPESFLAREPLWTPTLPKAVPTNSASWGFSDLIHFQQVIDPV